MQKDEVSNAKGVQIGPNKTSDQLMYVPSALVELVLVQRITPQDPVATSFSSVACIHTFLSVPVDWVHCVKVTTLIENTLRILSTRVVSLFSGTSFVPTINLGVMLPVNSCVV